MKRIAVERGEFLLIVRLSNAVAIERVFGAAARKAALRQIESEARLFLAFPRTLTVGYDEVFLAVPAQLVAPEQMHAVLDTLCLRLSTRPMAFAGAQILLAVDAGHSCPADKGMFKVDLQLQDQAREQLAASAMPLLLKCPYGLDEVHQYRADLALAAKLLEGIACGRGLFAWRPVYNSRAPDQILYCDALLRLIGADGKQADCRAGEEALRRLGLSYLRDRQLVSHAMDELEGDVNACLAIRIAPSSLCFNLNGQGFAWSDTMLRLQNFPRLAERLTLELAEPTSERMLPAAKAFVEKLKALGVKITIAGFASDFSSIRQMLAFQPDAIKLPGAFLRSMSRMTRHDVGLRHLIGLAGTFTNVVIVEGVESAEDLKQARKEGAEWLVGDILGRTPRDSETDLNAVPMPHPKEAVMLRSIHSIPGSRFQTRREAVQNPFLRDGTT